MTDLPKPGEIIAFDDFIKVADRQGRVVLFAPDRPVPNGSSPF